ncbi:MAG: threonylcarbamoyl-AMP synthase [Lachnospiraceae bacterium]|nr:threonylcarbamoyl-AMP synthase [Lachnospiraceae bacterium]
MITKKLVFDRNREEEWDFSEANEIIRNGGLVAFPTETVYGLGGDATNPEASKKIYAAKGRPSDNPLIVHIHDFKQLEAIAKNVPDDARKLCKAFWPGPLTMIVEKNETIPYETTGGMDTVAVRMPSHPIARRFLQESNVMIAAPSANTSGRPSPTIARHVIEDLDGKIDCIIDGGSCDIGLESSIIDLSTDIPTILRPGYINKEMFEKALGKEVRIDPGIIDANANKGIRPKAPGMKYRHYAPKGNLVVVEGNDENVVSKINELAKTAFAEGKKVGIIATDETKDRYETGNVVTIGDRNDEDSIARHLFGVLRDFDDLEVDTIYSESFGTPRIGMAIMNRLLKAAGHQVIKVD